MSGHVGGVSCIRFTADDSSIVSIGQRDRAVYIWKVEQGEEEVTIVAAP